jgi:phosphatidylinositol alpha-1,6-mannosyltransferase
LLITLGFPPARGGIQACLYERARRAAGRILVLAPAHPAAADFDRQQPFRIERWPAWCSQTPGLKRVAQLIFSLALAWRLCRRYPIRWIECGQALPFGVVAWLLWKLRGIPYRVWVYGDDVIKPARNLWVRPLLLGCLRPAGALLAVSHYSRRLFMDLGLPAGRCQVIYPPIALDDFTYVEPPGQMILLSVARLEPRKGVDQIIRLLPALLQTHPAATLRIAGDGSARPALAALARQLDVADKVHFLGDVSPADLPATYAGCDLFVLLPTPDEARGEAEGFGIVYLEAAASGRPSVAWRTGGVAEALDDGRSGRLVEYGDLAGARQAIAALLDDPAGTRRLGRAARAWAESAVAGSAGQIALLDEAP